MFAIENLNLNYSDQDSDPILKSNLALWEQ